MNRDSEASLSPAGVRLGSPVVQTGPPSAAEPLELLVITANREQHRVTVVSPRSKTVGSFKEDLERVVWIKREQQLLFILSPDVHLLWDDSMLMAELLRDLTIDSNSASPRLLTPNSAADSRPTQGGSPRPQDRRRPIRLLLVRDFLGVLASTSIGALPPVWHMDHYQFMLRMVSPEPGLPAEEVFPGLFLGELGAVYKRTQLKEQKIGSILSAECMPPLWPEDFRYLVIKADETQNCNMLEIFEQALKFMQDGLKHGKVLVHCMLGVSRAATLVVAFVMRELQVSTEEALEVVGRRRRVFPNHSFLEQLRWFHAHQWSVDKQTQDYRALKAQYSTPAQIVEYPP